MTQPEMDEAKKTPDGKYDGLNIEDVILTELITKTDEGVKANEEK